MLAQHNEMLSKLSEQSSGQQAQLNDLQEVMLSMQDVYGKQVQVRVPACSAQS